MYSFGFEPFRDWFLLSGFADCNDGKWLDIIRKVKQFLHLCFSFLTRVDTAPDGTQSDSVSSQ